MQTCDLHMHSTASDGTDAPEALAAVAIEAGVAAIALTDHDTTQGVAACAKACEAAGVEFASGIELSVDPGEWPAPRDSDDDTPRRRGTLHILGLFVDPDNAELQSIHERLVQARADRNPEIIRNLNELGVKIDYDDVVAIAHKAGGTIVGRPHIAQAMLSAGYVKSVHEAFARYIGEGKPAYARKDLLSAEEAFAAIHDARGLALLAHPVQLRYGPIEQFEHFVKQLKEVGLDGIETMHSDHTPTHVKQFEAIADRFELLTTGGSDYHGSRKRIAMGSQSVPYRVYADLRDAWAARSTV